MMKPAGQLPILDFKCGNMYNKGEKNHYKGDDSYVT